MVDIDELERLALAATPGPWWQNPDAGNQVCLGDVNGIDICFVAGPGDDWSEANQAFIAAANPAVILGLVAEVRRLRAAKEWAEWTASFRHACEALESHNDDCLECEEHDDRGDCEEGRRLDAAVADLADLEGAVTESYMRLIWQASVSK